MMTAIVGNADLKLPFLGDCYQREHLNFAFVVLSPHSTGYTTLAFRGQNSKKNIFFYKAGDVPIFRWIISCPLDYHNKNGS